MSNTHLKDLFVSVVVDKTILSENTGDRISKLYDILSTTYTHSEIIILDDDDHQYENQILKLLNDIPKIRYIRLFGSNTQNQLIAAGLENAIGDIIIALKHINEISNITRLVSSCCEQFDVAALKLNIPTARSIFSECITGLAVSRRYLNAVLRMQSISEYSECKNFYTSPFLEILNNCTNKTYLDTHINNITSWYNMIINSLHNVDINKYTKYCYTVFAFIVGMLTHCMLTLDTSVFLYGGYFIIFAYSIYAYLCCNNITSKAVNGIIYTVQFEKNSSVMLDLTELNIRTDSVSSTINVVQTGRNK